jgi:hypothetical protein
MRFAMSAIFHSLLRLAIVRQSIRLKQEKRLLVHTLRVGRLILVSEGIARFE